MYQSYLRNISSSHAFLCAKPNSNSALSRVVPRLTVLLFLSVMLASSAAAQTAQFTQGSSGTNTMTLQVPLGALPGRGVSLPINLNYSSKVWRLGFIKSVYYTYGGSNSVAEAIYSEYATAGWTTSLDVPVVEWPKQNDAYWYTGKPYARGTHYPYTFRVAQVFIHMPDGSTHTLRKADQVYQDNGSVDMNGTFYAVDGSRMRYDSSGATTGTLFLADGTRYVFSAGTTQYIDRNGNTLSYNTSSRQWTDTLGRTIGMPWPTNPQAIDYPYSIPGVNGTNITYTLKFKNLADALTLGSPARLPVGDYYLPNPAQTPGDYNSSNFTQPTQGTSMFVSGYSDPDELDYQTFTRVIGRGQVGSTPFNPVVLAEIVLPTLNGVVQSYKFSYNNFGELDKVTYPTGAYQRYQYNVVPALGNPLVPYPQVSRGITSRWLSATGSGLLADEVQWLYEFAGAGSISVTAPGPTGLADGIKTVTYLYNYGNPQNNFGYDSALNGLAYEERVYAPGNGPMIRRTLTDWAVSSATYNRPPQGTGTYTATRNAHPTKTVSLILDTGGVALTSAESYVYDPTYQFSVGLDRTSTTEYPFTTVDQATAQSGGISAIPLASSPIRTSETTFLTSDANYRSRNILGLASSSVVKNGTGTIVSQASFSYDQSAFPLLTYGSVTGWTDPQSPYRGNVTTVARWVDYPTSAWIYTHAQYDQCGSVRKAWAASDTGLTNPGQVSYADAFADGVPRNTYAFPTSTTSAVPDPSGTFGQTTGLVSTTVYDFNTGLVTSATDPNGRTTTFEYNDPLNRPRKVNRPDGGWTSTNYHDDPADIHVTTQTLAQTSPTQQILTAYQHFDKLGRGVRSFLSEGSTYIISDTKYDKLGRLWRVSNPYRSTSLTAEVNPTDKWTTNTYDTLSRVTAVTAPDGSQATTAYAYSLTAPYLGPTLTATDPTLKARKSLTDAQGRLIQVIEAPNAVLPDVPLLTNYTYDVLNNLRKVEQGSQLRYFGYDSLSRVIRTRAVEQTVNTALNWTDPVTTYNGGWTTGVSYDNNGNVTSRVDARNVTTTYGYDALNRNTTVHYTDGTKDIDRHYDNPTANKNGLGRLWYLNWDPNNNTRFDTHIAIDEYDVMGRPKNYRQHFLTNGVASPQFNVTYTYNPGGQVTAETYPSGHTVSYTYDAAGRLNNFSGNLGDGASRTYATGISYSEFGGLQQEQFGTQVPLYHKLHYNVRGQLYDIRLSTAAWATDQWNWNRGGLINYYATADLSCQTNECRANSGPDNNGSVRQTQHWISTDDQMSGYNWTEDRYSYDALNRLGSVTEYHGSNTAGLSGPDFAQVYDYDRYGNRTINPSSNISNMQFDKADAQNTNRLYAPGDTAIQDMNQRRIRYDAAGNQTNDTYTGAGQRTYDGENHLKQAQGSPNNQWQTYTYDAGGRRIKRNVNGVETWNVYGMGGELLAEYKSGAAPFLPAKEYGYRGGELLVTMASGDDVRLSRFVTNLYYGAKQADPTSQQLQDAVNQLAAAGATSQSQLLTVASQIARSLFTGTNYESSRSDAQYVADLYYTYLQRGPDDSGLGWWTGQVASSGRANVCNAFEGSSEFVTLVATLYGTAASDNERTEHLVNNFYLGARGTSASSTELQQQRDALNAAAAQGMSQVQAQAESFGRSLFAAQVNDASISNTQYVTNLYEAFLQRGPDAGGLAWWSGQATVGQGRQNVLGSFATCGPFYELAGTLYREAFWLVADHLGTPRMIVNKSGTLASVKRHDYLPFGEEIGGPQVALIGGRTTTQGYTGDSVRQHFTGYEADGETGLNFAQARYQSPAQGRFTSVDPLGASASVGDPQSFNRYSYVNNNPTNLTDPSGMQAYDASNSYTDAAGSLEAQPFDPNRSHFGGPAILFAAGLFHDVGVMAASQGSSGQTVASGRAVTGHSTIRGAGGAAAQQTSQDPQVDTPTPVLLELDPIITVTVTSLTPQVPQAAEPTYLPAVPRPVPAPLAGLLRCMQGELNQIPGSQPLIVTATTNGRHNVGSAHYNGDAADLRYNDHGTDSARRLQAAADCGALFAQDEGTRPPGQKVWSGPHYHVQLTAGPNGTRGDLPPPRAIP